MQQFHKSSPLTVRPKVVHSPAPETLSEGAYRVPASFADWLSQSTCVIAPEAKPEQETFAGLMNQCAAQNLTRPF